MAAYNFIIKQIAVNNDYKPDSRDNYNKQE